jgi:hypothetical protein
MSGKGVQCAITQSSTGSAGANYFSASADEVEESDFTRGGGGGVKNCVSLFEVMRFGEASSSLRLIILVIWVARENVSHTAYAQCVLLFGARSSGIAVCRERG